MQLGRFAVYRYDGAAAFGNEFRLVNKERPKTRLHEVPIGRQRFMNSAVLHHDERDTVGQSPILVRAGGIERECSVEELGVNRHDRHPGIGA